MGDEDNFATMRDEISNIVSRYCAERDDEFIATEWVLVVGMTKMDWQDGRQAIFTIHPNVPYSARLGLLTSAQSDLLLPVEDD